MLYFIRLVCYRSSRFLLRVANHLGLSTFFWKKLRSVDRRSVKLLDSRTSTLMLAKHSVQSWRTAWTIAIDSIWWVGGWLFCCSFRFAYFLRCSRLQPFLSMRPTKTVYPFRRKIPTYLLTFTSRSHQFRVLCGRSPQKDWAAMYKTNGRVGCGGNLYKSRLKQTLDLKSTLAVFSLVLAPGVLGTRAW